MSHHWNGNLGRLSFRHALVPTSVLILTIFANIALYSQLTSLPSRCNLALPVSSAPTDSSNSVINSSNRNEPDAIYSGTKITLPAIKWFQGRLDSRRMLRIYEWTWIGSQWKDLTKTFDVCLATHVSDLIIQHVIPHGICSFQSSLDRIFSIVEVAEKWLGPISLAVYIRTPDEWIALNLFVMYMQRCSAPFAQTVSIHVAVPVNYEPSNNDNSRLTNFSLWSTHPCGQPEEFVSILMKEIVTITMDPASLYPQNHMRNVARKTCRTSWIFLTDVDIIPRPNSAQMLQEFYDSPASNCSKCEFVIPTFELSTEVKYPESKQALIDYVKKGVARQFQLEASIHAQLSTKYHRWAYTNLEESSVKISHGVDRITGMYEPFYVGTDLVPSHDERFIGFGHDRDSQVLEALELGWTFKVITPIFAIHWGFKLKEQPIGIADIKDTSTPAKSRRAQFYNNGIIFNAFVAELKARKNVSMAYSKEKQLGNLNLKGPFD